LIRSPRTVDEMSSCSTMVNRCCL